MSFAGMPPPLTSGSGASRVQSETPFGRGIAGGDAEPERVALSRGAAEREVAAQLRVGGGAGQGAGEGEEAAAVDDAVRRGRRASGVGRTSLPLNFVAVTPRALYITAR